MPQRELAPLPPKEFPHSPSELQEFAEGYELTTPIHKSNVSTVYAAKDPNIPGFVAVKFSVLTGRLENEVRSGELTEDSPYVIDYYDHAIDEDRSLGYVVTPYTFLDMGSKHAVFQSENDKLATLRDVARGLLDLHGEGLVHRDVKPRNVFLSENLLGGRGRNQYSAFLGDLGIVCENGYTRDLAVEDTQDVLPSPDITQAGNMILPIGWAAPEQYDRQKTLTTKVDAFSFGFLISRTLLGVNPFSVALGYHHPGMSILSDQEKITDAQKQALESVAIKVDDFSKHIPTASLD